MNHYEYLGLPPDSPVDAVRDAVDVAKRRWNIRLGAAADERARARAEAALKRLGEVEATLTDRGRRAVYDAVNLPTEPPIAEAGARSPLEPGPEAPTDEVDEAIDYFARRLSGAMNEMGRPSSDPAPEDPRQRARLEREAEIARQEAERLAAEEAERLERERVVRERAVLPPADRKPRSVRLGRRPAAVQHEPRPALFAGLAGAGAVAVALGVWAIASMFPSRDATPRLTLYFPGARSAAVSRYPQAQPSPTEMAPRGSWTSTSSRPRLQASPRVAREAMAATASPVVLMREAYAFSRDGDNRSSLALYDRLLTAHPGNAIAHVGRALTLLQMDRPAAAERDCRAAIALVPRFPEAHYDLAVALHRQHRDAAAVAEFHRFLALAPDDPAAPAARGFIARMLLDGVRR